MVPKLQHGLIPVGAAPEPSEGELSSVTATWLHPQPQGLPLPCRKKQVLLWAGEAARSPCALTNWTFTTHLCISAGKLNPVPLDVALHEGAQCGWGWRDDGNAVMLGVL